MRGLALSTESSGFWRARPFRVTHFIKSRKVEKGDKERFFLYFYGSCFWDLVFFGFLSVGKCSLLLPS